ncbi:hypothetical protein ACFSSC_10890 [Corynebacterium mendelii]|uniref:Uncharacterized protein n=1 Tax=Corynebacterium mendelii TaxID=2765362 RepID=A0A939IVQ1_9CORY|nr:hypothetical protein [Corynebacterium mendelii]MBN9644466.1 hypothetical protein [Corynebacterium mendelii]
MTVLAPVPGSAHLKLVDSPQLPPPATARPGTAVARTMASPRSFGPCPVDRDTFGWMCRKIVLCVETAAGTRPLTMMDRPEFGAAVRREVVIQVNTARRPDTPVSMLSCHVQAVPGTSRYEVAGSLRCGTKRQAFCGYFVASSDRRISTKLQLAGLRIL